jgi:hypothetical protein
VLLSPFVSRALGGGAVSFIVISACSAPSDNGKPGVTARSAGATFFDHFTDPSTEAKAGVPQTAEEPCYKSYANGSQTYYYAEHEYSGKTKAELTAIRELHSFVRVLSRLFGCDGLPALSDRRQGRSCVATNNAEPPSNIEAPNSTVPAPNLPEEGDDASRSAHSLSFADSASSFAAACLNASRPFKSAACATTVDLNSMTHGHQTPIDLRSSVKVRCGEAPSQEVRPGHNSSFRRVHRVLVAAVTEEAGTIDPGAFEQVIDERGLDAACREAHPA